ncbi:hypothetical protein HRE53_32870 (plasmid) [Acaryochloris sp. 'Moss Beach']|uniref:hypothetical protein n=1 Tax=Acaryochloris sp. 'Moss Beach' TaxID=2740837 RepID=UPI001F39F920|nr:hypothetical protein [Acaryochloris sp. 'Moss Beach']UJB73425.1 hypothetical protein HRE53_32870 [Acaryochloris sp. 'Moss Beach']
MTDVLSDMQNKKRPKKLTKSRDTSMAPDIAVDTQEKNVKEAPEAQNTQVPMDLKGPLESELASIPTIGKRRNLRLGEDIDEQIQDYCRQHEISHDVLIEALFLQLESNTALETEVLKEANNRHRLRKRAGQIRRLLNHY